MTEQKRIASTVLTWARRTVLAALWTGLTGCSLVSLKSPEKPLSTRDLNARILTREYSAHFISGVEQTADEIAADTEDSQTRLDALRWKIAASGKSQRAASQMAPMMGLLDTWALSVQMSDYLASGGGRALFGRQQPLAVTLAGDLARAAQDLAQRLTDPEEFEQYQRFIEEYAREHPIEDLHFTRVSVVDLWTHGAGAKTKLVDSLGTVPEALADAGDRLRMYGETGPSQVLWQAELAAQQAGISGKEVRLTLRRLDDRVAELSAMVNAAPKMVTGAMRDAGLRFDSTWAEMMRDIHAEEVALSSSVNDERQAALTALDLERAAVTADAARISDQVIRQAGEEVRRLVREALAFIIVLTLVVLGIPFAAGYLVGRARRA